MATGSARPSSHVSRLSWLLYAAWTAGLVLTALKVNQIVPQPFIDETIHIPQAQRYCRGDFFEWDDRITTPPGLYIMSYIGSRISQSLCEAPGIRWLNVLAALLLPFLYYDLFPPNDKRSLQAMALASFPLPLFVSLLYYTDVMSLVFVLASLAAARRQSYISSALFAFVSLWFRQTNIVWTIYVAGDAVLNHLCSFEQLNMHNPRLTNMRPADWIVAPLSFLGKVLASLPLLHSILGPFLPIVGIFAAFIRWNGGIVLGHKDNHAVQLHVPQLYYFVAFCVVFAWPTIVSRRRLIQSLRTTTGSLKRLALSTIALMVTLYSIQRFTIIHPFVLADNRHYTFYVVRRILNRTAWSKFALAPAYLLGIVLLFESLASSGMTILQLIMLLACTAATIVPTPLIEPRYFITPYVLLRLHLRPPPDRPRARLVLEALFGLAVHAVTTAYFLRRTWPSWEGEGRLMW